MYIKYFLLYKLLFYSVFVTFINMKKFFIDNKYICILWILCLTALLIFTGHYSNILLDVGREVYYPQQILNGKLLYKDLFVIYGPFSYMWNALLYKLFGTNLMTLYLSGAVCSLGIVSGIYLIAKKFLSEFMSFALGFFTIVTGVCAFHLFNFTFPYSWGMLYGTLGFIYSVFFLIKYKQTDFSKYLYLSALLAGFSAVNKYDFIIYSVFLFIIAIFSKNLKIILNFITCFAIVPVISFGILFTQGLSIDNLIETGRMLHKITQSKTLEFFYKSQGVFFNRLVFEAWAVNFLKTAAGLLGLFLSGFIMNKNRAAGYIIAVISVIASYYLAGYKSFVFLIPLLFIFAITTYKELKNNIPLFVLVLSSIAVSVKSFWGLTPANYGNYYTAILLVSFFALLFTLVAKKYQKYAAIFMITVSISYLAAYSLQRSFLNSKISTKKGTIYTSQPYADATNELLKFLENKENTDMVIFPEGLLVNFLSKNSTPADDFYNSLIPLYSEAFTDEAFIKHFEKTKPVYIVFNNQSMKDYYFPYICQNYALQFCGYVNENYTKVKDIYNGLNYLIFQRNH